MGMYAKSKLVVMHCTSQFLAGSTDFVTMCVCASVSMCMVCVSAYLSVSNYESSELQVWMYNEIGCIDTGEVQGNE